MAELETVPIEDRGMLSEIMADREPEAAPEPEANEPAETERPRDEHGRFVSRATDADAAPLQQQPLDEQQPAPEPAAEPAAESPGVRQLREAHERAERRAEEARFQAYSLQQQLQERDRQLAELNKPKPTPVDFFENPEGALQQRVEPIQQGFERQLNEMRLDMSRELAVTRHGEAAVAEMETAIAQAMQQNHPDMAALAAKMRTSKFPALDAMQWHQQAKLQREVGNDLGAYKTKLQEQLLADPEFLAKAVAKATGQAQQAAAQPGTRPAISLPPSLNRATGAGLSNSDPADAGDMTDRGLFRHAMGNRR